MPPRQLPCRRLAAGSVGSLLCAVVLAGCVGGNSVDPAAGSGINTRVGGGALTVFAEGARKRAPVLRGSTLDGAALDTSTWRGSVVVVNFWASWCAPCRAEGPNLERVYAATAPLGVRFLGIDFKDARVDARSYVANTGIRYPSLFDGPGELGLAFARSVPFTSTPTTYVVDRSGRIAARNLGGVTAEELAPVVRAVAAERPA